MKNARSSKGPQIGAMGQLFNEDLIKEIEFAVKHGFDWVEIDLDWKHNYKITPAMIKKIRQIAKESGIRYIVHTPFYLPVSTMLPEIKQGLLNYTKKAVMLAKKIGSDRMTFHPGYREMPGPAVKLCYAALKENLTAIVGIAKKHKIHVCFENFNKDSGLLCYELENYLDVLNSVKGLKTTLDIGHANTTNTMPTEYFNAVSHTIMDMHVHDNNGEHDEHKCPGEGNIDFVSLFRACKKAGYFGPFTLEVFPDDNLVKARQKVIEYWQKA